MLSECQGHQNIDILVPRIAHKATQGVTKSSQAAPGLADIADMAAKQPTNEVPKYQTPSRARPTAITGALTLV